MNFNLQKAMIFLVCLNLTLFLGGVRVVDNTALNSIVDVEGYDNGTVSLSGEFKDSVPENFENTGESDGLTFIDTMNSVKNFVIFIVNIIFAPIGLFATLPPEAGIMLGVPLVVASVIALIYFIRSGR